VGTTASAADVEVRRVYEPPEPGRERVLVDRLWPRGISKEKAALDRWDRDVAPSTDLRRWYGHQPDLFDEFSRRYRSELQVDPALSVLRVLVSEATGHAVDLVTATHDVEHSGARVLREVIVDRVGAEASS